MKRSGRHPRRKMNMFGSTEDFIARQDRWARRPVDSIETRRRAIMRNSLDPKVTTLYEYVTRWNAQHSTDRWISVDHIRPVNQGGEHMFGNLRLIPLHVNVNEFRLEATIQDIIARVAAGRNIHGLMFVDTDNRDYLP